VLAVLSEEAQEGRMMMMKLTLGVVVVALALVLVSGAAWSYPTRFGPVTGLVDLPTPDVLENGMAEVALDYSKLDHGQKVWPARLVLGVTDAGEVGVGWAKVKNGTSDEITSFAGKMMLMKEPEQEFGLAFGGAWLDGSTNDLLQVYAVMSKQFPTTGSDDFGYGAGRVRLRGHAGLMFTRVKDGVDDDELKPFVGFDVTTPEGTAFVAEYKWTKFGEDHAAAALRYPVTPAITIQAGVARAGTILGQDDYRFIIGLSYALGTRASNEGAPGY
jgi:hypothetical protein